MTGRAHPSLLSALLLFALSPLAACERSGTEEGASETAPAPAQPLDGLYEVEGFTVNRDTGADERKISGTIAIAIDGANYRATFDLKTTAQGLGGSHGISVIGRGDGIVVERTLSGTAQTQLVTSVVPGVDPGFAFIPRQTSTRIVSRSTAEIAADGKVKVTIESDGAAGENYVATRTRLRGKRVGDRPARAVKPGSPPAPDTGACGSAGLAPAAESTGRRADAPTAAPRPPAWNPPGPNRRWAWNPSGRCASP